jgi:hypothetical protein
MKRLTFSESERMIYSTLFSNPISPSPALFGKRSPTSDRSEGRMVFFCSVNQNISIVAGNYS